MSETARDVFAKYEIRKTKRQKTAFIQHVSSVADAEGYECRVEKGYLGARNIVVGNPDTAPRVLCDSRKASQKPKSKNSRVRHKAYAVIFFTDCR